MRVLLFAPNAGLSFSTGGGSGVGCKLAEVLLEAGHEVTLAGYHSLDLAGLDALHGTGMLRYGDRVRLRRGRALDPVLGMYRHLPVKLSAYTGLLAPAFGAWVRRTLRSTPCDRVIFQDDVPAAAGPFLPSLSYLVYVHFPFLGLSPQWVPPLRGVLTGAEWTNDRLLAGVARRIIVLDPAEHARAVLTNSTVTARVVRSVWPSARPEYVPTYLDPMVGRPEKDPLLFALGTVQPAKNYELLLEAFERLHPRHPDARLLIAGHSRDPRYVRRLRRRIARAGLAGSAEVRLDLSRREVLDALGRTLIQVHPATFEPFGLALLEGIAFGAAGVASRSEYAGGWVDILERGEHGAGFADATELSERLDRWLSDREEASRWGGIARARAATFSRRRLAERIRPYFSDGPSAPGVARVTSATIVE